MRILIIGGNGFIGAPLVRELQAAGHTLAIFHRGATPSESNPNITFIQGDRNRLADYRLDLQRFSPEVIVDLILSSGRQAQQLMETVAGITRRVVAISSMDVYRAWGVLQGIEPGLTETSSITEDSPLRTARRLYPEAHIKTMQSVFSWLSDDYDKIAVEEAVMNYPTLPATILRLPMVYGPGDPLHRFFPLLKRIDDHRSFVLLPEDLAAWRGPRGYVDNVAHAIALAATSENAAGPVYNVCQDPSASELEWQTEIAAQANWTGQFVTIPKDLVPKHLLTPGNLTQHFVASSQRIRTELGYQEPVDIPMAIRQTIVWERQNPPATVNPPQFDYESEDIALANFQKLPH